MSILRREENAWIALSFTIYASFICIFMEWLFFVTKPSFMDSLDVLDFIGTVLIPPLWLALLTAPVAVVAALIPAFLNNKLSSGLLLPAFLLSILSLMLIDNFTYTVFSKGIVTSGVIGKAVFVMLLIIIFIKLYKLLLSLEEKILKSKKLLFHKLATYFLIFFSITSMGIVFAAYDEPVVLVSESSPKTLPNIIFFASDGIEARYTSIDGFELDTTPFLEKLQQNSLVAANAYSNSGKSTGATTAMLTGRTPFATKVGFPPHILAGNNSYLHLPGILNELGYQGFQGGVRYYIDGGDLNMRNAFDESNGRELWNPDVGSLPYKLSSIFNGEIYFSRRILERISTRLKHIFGIEDMVSHFLLVQEHAGSSWEADREVIDNAVEFIAKQDNPYFAHLHLMGTHCCSFFGARAKLVRELEQGNGSNIKAENATRRYINTIRDADDHLAYFISELRRIEKLENTVVVISSDHSRGWSSLQRVPLIISFPNSDHAKQVFDNVSLIDVAPTLLDYMGIDKPEWMDGVSLINVSELFVGNDNRLGRPIVTMESYKYTRLRLKSGVLSRIDDPGPPTYGLAEVGVVSCKTAYKVSIETGAVSSSQVSMQNQSCTPQYMLDVTEAEEAVRNTLDINGFNTQFQNFSENPVR